MKSASFIAGCVAAAVAAAPTPARAQDNSTAFSVERFMPPPGDHALLSTDEPAVLRHLELSFGAVGSLMSRPVILRRTDGAQIVFI